MTRVPSLQMNKGAASAAVWPLVVLGLLGLNMAVVGVTIWLASADRSFAIEPDYYAKASAWNETAHNRDLAAQRGWDVSVLCEQPSNGGRSFVRVVLTETSGATRVPLENAEVSLELFAQSRASLRQSVRATRSGAGTYTAAVKLPVRGLWEVRVGITRGADRAVLVRTMLVDRAGEEESR